MKEYAIFGIVWAVFCIAEFFAVPMVARAREKDVGIWFLVTVIWLCFDTFLAVFAHWAGFALFSSILKVGKGNADPQDILFGVIGLIVSAFFVYMPLWALLLSSPKKQLPRKATSGHRINIPKGRRSYQGRQRRPGGPKPR